MSRPPEYENLIKTRAFEAVQPTPGAMQGFLKNAQDYLEVAQGLDPTKALQVFTLAYEGYFSIVQAPISAPVQGGSRRHAGHPAKVAFCCSFTRHRLSMTGGKGATIGTI
jgi:hypothetical protein